VRIIGIDWGEKRIGVAVSDPLQNIAYGVRSIENSRDNGVGLKNIEMFLDEYSPVEEIIVGLPKTMRGETGKKAEEVLLFVERLKGVVNIPVFTWDERLSTVAAERPLKDANISVRKRKKLIDASAAAFMLQGYLDHKKRAAK